MRATSSGMCNSIPYAIRRVMKIKDLAEFLDEKAGRNSLLLKKLLGGFFRGCFQPEYYFSAMVLWAYS